MSPSEQRAMVVREARKWIGTPYHHAGDILGAGVDCGMLLVRVYVDTGLAPPFDPRPYPPDWNLHRSEERYLAVLEGHVHELPVDAKPGAGDIVVFQHGRTFSHGGIVTDWPLLVHAYHTSGIVEEADYSKELKLQYIGPNPRPMKMYSLWDDQ